MDKKNNMNRNDIFIFARQPFPPSFPKDSPLLQIKANLAVSK